MNADSTARKHHDARPEAAREPRRVRQILVVEPDPLTQWSLRTYLSKWFSIHSTGSLDSARRVLETHAVDVLVVADELPAAAVALLEQCAHNFNARVRIVRTVADLDRPRETGPSRDYIEKPFQLADLARLLGIPDHEIPED